MMAAAREQHQKLVHSGVEERVRVGAGWGEVERWTFREVEEKLAR